MIRYPYEIINVEKKYELPNNLVDEHNRYVELKLTDYETMQQPERNELNDLSELLYPYNISSGDWNKFQEITANLQKFITIDLVNYINESYFTMEDVRNEIDLKIDIFKIGDLITILKECLKRWGGGDYMGKEMYPISFYGNESNPIFRYENNNGGMLVLTIEKGDYTMVTLQVDGREVISQSASFEIYGIPAYTNSSTFTIPFLNDVVIIIEKGASEPPRMGMKGFAYINPSEL